MAGFKKQHRQRIIDGYLAETGRNMFVAAEFIDWLGTQPEHEAYSAFYGIEDEAAAREHRITMARRMVSGLRIVSKSDNKDWKGNVVSISVTEHPSFISPVAGRRSGGGYQPFDPKDAEQVAELRRQGVTGLKSWLRRYAGVFGTEAKSVFEIVEANEAAEAEAKDGSA